MLVEAVGKAGVKRPTQKTYRRSKASYQKKKESRVGVKNSLGGN